MEIDTKYEKCKSCKHFLQHYVKEQTTFFQTNFGHCVNGEMGKV